MKSLKHRSLSNIIKYKTLICLIFKSSLILTAFLYILSSCKKGTEVFPVKLNAITITDSIKQKEHLNRLLGWLPPDRTFGGGALISSLDTTFTDWLKRTGELPPDFDNMHSIPFLPNPLVMDEGGENIPITTMEQWEEKREWMKRHLEYYITGTYPAKPDNLKAAILNERKDGETLIQMVELTFGPDHQAKLTLELMIPPGEGPFPVFMTQWNHREWAQIALRRGYIGCVYAGADAKDDTEHYSEIWAGEYDFTVLMRRAYGASRAIDYLYTLPIVDKDKIGITGHSRNGKQSLIAAAFDERITACIPSSAGAGGPNPWRYHSENFDVENIAGASVSWFHPRLRFFVGHEHKLPVDQNHFLALIAPRGLMLSYAYTEWGANPWGKEQVYHESSKVYKFLDAENNLALRSRHGLHSISARDMEDYMDFFDYVFKRSDHKPQSELLFTYSFENWKKLSNESLNPMDYPVKGMNDIDIDQNNNKITSIFAWENKKEQISENIQWLLGDEPPGVTNPGPGSLDRAGRGERSFGTFITRPQPTSTMGKMPISPYNGFGDQLFGYLYYPMNAEGFPKSQNLPALIYLHEYDYSKGSSTHRYRNFQKLEGFFQSVVNSGYCIFVYDMLGFGNRIEEGTRFYNRYPHWSKMGKMVVDAKGAVEAMVNLDFIDSSKVYIAGYSLGGLVSLLTAATDTRIAGVASISGFTPMRSNTLDRGTEGIKTFSHLHGLMPRLGFFPGHEARIPLDFHEILACLAPRPLFIIAPAMDRYAHLTDIKLTVKEADKIYNLYDRSNQITFFSPDDYNRFSDEMKDKLYQWLREL